MSTVPVLASLVTWLRAGYPYGVPETDVMPLLSLLARRLTDEEVLVVATELGGQDGPVDSNDIADRIRRLTAEPPRNEDVDRVRSHLDQAGPFL